VSRDGSTLLVSDYGGGSHAIHELDVADGSLRRVIGGKGDAPLQFDDPRQVWVAYDGFVFVADCKNHRVQVLKPNLDFHGFVGVGQLSHPSGVCANADVVVVAEVDVDRLAVFNRGDGTLLRRIGSSSSMRGQLNSPLGLCFMASNRHVAVAEYDNNRVSVFGLDGEFIRHVGDGSLRSPEGVACSADDELVVADTGNRRVVVFSGTGELLKTMGRGEFGGIAMHSGAVFAQDAALSKEQFVVFK
jgi:DNA-binding beta-propeller fold protein YncE